MNERIGKWIVWVNAPYIKLGKIKTIDGWNCIHAEIKYSYDFFTSSYKYPTPEDKLLAPIGSSVNQKIFEMESDANEFLNFLKNELPSIYVDFNKLDEKIKELEKLKKSNLWSDLKITFNEKWINDQRYNKLKSILEENL
jgi:hypothetical protein